MTGLGPGACEISSLQPDARHADERMDAPVPVQEELRCLRRIANVLERLTRAIVSSFAKRLEACRQLTDGLRLPGRIEAAVEQALADAACTREIHRQCSQPRLAILKEPRIAAILLRQVLTGANDP